MSEAESLTSSRAAPQRLDVLAAIRRTAQARGRRSHHDHRPGQCRDGAPRSSQRTGHRRGGAPVGTARSGRKGSLVYTAARVTLTQAERVTLAKADHHLRLLFRGTLAVLLTRDVGDLGPSWGYFIVAGGAALLVAALVAWQMSAPDGAASGRGHGGHGPHRRRRPGQPRPRPARRLPRVRLAGRLHQRHGPEPAGRPCPGASSSLVGIARPAHPAHVHPWLRRGHSGRGDRGQRPSGRRDHRRVATAGAPRR